MFPYKYWKPSYQNLCGQYGVHYRSVRNVQPTSPNRQRLQHLTTEDCMRTLECRSYARADDVHITHKHMQEIVDTARQVQFGLIGAHNAPYIYSQSTDNMS